MRYLILSLVMCVAACGQSEAELPLESEEPSAEQPAADEDANTSLAGSWRVAQIDGQAHEAIPPLELYANSRLIYWEPACAGMERRYVIEEDVFSASPTPSDGPKIVCSIGLPEGLQDVFDTLDEADRIESVDGGGVLISGLRRRIILLPI